MNNFALYEITDNGLAFISKHGSSVAAMIQSSIHTDSASGEWEKFKSGIQKTWVSDTFCIIEESVVEYEAANVEVTDNIEVITYEAK